MGRLFMFIFIISGFCQANLYADGKYRGKVLDSATVSPVVGAVVKVCNTDIWAITDSEGNFQLPMLQGIKYDKIDISCLGYKNFTGRFIDNHTWYITPRSFSIDEVVVTATESKGLTSVSRIGEDAISHIQPSSFTDLLELIPGGRSHDPVFGSPQTINLRSAGGYSSTSALGTKFIIDGVNIGNDANMQYTPAFSRLGSSFMNQGMDMRTISTEDIVQVDIVRGIPSVEYGDLTSGVVNIKRRKGGNDLRARFKADMTSKLFYAAKGFETKDNNRFTANMSFNILDTRMDPRNLRQNYKRATASLRVGKQWNDEKRKFAYNLNCSTDYTGSFDNQKSDRDIDIGDKRALETYRSSYNRLLTATSFSVNSKDIDRFFKSFSFKASFSIEKDLIDRWKYFVAAVSSPVSVSMEPGEFDAIKVPFKYETTMQIEGRPFYGSITVSAAFRKSTGRVEHNVNIGSEWNMDKNYGRGVIFDVYRPFSLTMNVRPRAYNAIPATQMFAGYTQYRQKINFRNFRLESSFGARISAKANIGHDYVIQFKPYIDPRINIRLDMPSKTIWGQKLEYGVYGGMGMHRKFPTMGQLHPAPIYEDIVQFNYWPVEDNLRRINLLVCKIDPTNTGLVSANNIKWEIGTDFSLNGFSLSVNYFIEDMKSGFRNSSNYTKIISKDYDESAVNKSELTGPPDLKDLPFRLDTNLFAYSFLTNGSRNLKEGVEFTFTTRRIPAISTKLTVNGAWFRTRYSNSVPEYYRPDAIIKGKQYPYIGIYNITEGTLYEYFNTNFMFDSNIKKWGLIFSTSFQCLWYTSRDALNLDPYPLSYMDRDMEIHPFTRESAQNGILSHMIREFKQGLFTKETTPFSMNVNLKVMKKLYGDKVSCSLFVNKIFDISPGYMLYGRLIRRSVLPYFGMELYFKL